MSAFGIIHIYAGKAQRATSYIDDALGKRRRVRTNPRRQFRCFNCGHFRWAANLNVQVYYDCIRFFCREPCR